MPRWIPILVFTLPPIWPVLTGQYLFPFYSYPMYSTPPTWHYAFQIWVESDLGESMRVTSSRALWPVGPNGIDGTIKYLITSGKPESDFQKLLIYYARRFYTVGPEHLPVKGKITRVSIRQMHPFFDGDVARSAENSEGFVPKYLHSLEVPKATRDRGEK